MDKWFREDLRTAYDRQAGRRNTNSMQEWKREERSSFLALLQEEHKRSLLEIGSGAGWDSLFFQDHGLQVT